MNVIRQDADRNRIERPASLDCSIALPQPIDLIDQKIAVPRGKNDREKEQTARGFGSNVSRHECVSRGNGRHAAPSLHPFQMPRQIVGP
jgi:hypothetical protein